MRKNHVCPKAVVGEKLIRGQNKGGSGEGAGLNPKPFPIPSVFCPVLCSAMTVQGAAGERDPFIGGEKRYKASVPQGWAPPPRRPL